MNAVSWRGDGDRQRLYLPAMKRVAVSLLLALALSACAGMRESGPAAPPPLETQVAAVKTRLYALIANERTRAVKIELTRDKLTVSALSVENGVAVEEMPAAWDEGDFTAGFNSRFLLDLLAVAGDGELQVELFGEGNNLLALFTNPGDASAKWLLAPMNV